MVFGISTSYYEQERPMDEDEDDLPRHQDQYRNLRRKIDRIKQNQLAQRQQELDDESDDEDGGASGGRKKKVARPQLSTSQAQEN